MFKKVLAFFLGCCFSFSVLAQQFPVKPLLSTNKEEQAKWVQQIYDSLTIDQKIGQLIGLQLNASELSENRLYAKLKETTPVGSIFLSEVVDKKETFTISEWNKQLSVPLLVATEAIANLPGSTALAAIENEQLIRKTASHLGDWAKQRGIHLSFIPKPPFQVGGSTELVATSYTLDDIEKAKIYSNGLTAKGILSCGTFSPVRYQQQFALTADLNSQPFSIVSPEFMLINYYSELINGGVSAITTAGKNEFFPMGFRKIPSELSEERLVEIIKDKLRFQGLLVSGVIASEEKALDSFLAGHDVLRSKPNSILGIFNRLITAYQSGLITEGRLSLSVKKVLMAKFKAGVNKEMNTVSAEDEPEESLQEVEESLLREDIVENAITLIKNDLELVPVRNLDIKKIAYVPIGGGDYTDFLNTLRLYTNVDIVKSGALDALQEKLNSYNLIIVGLHPSASAAQKTNQFTAKDKTWLYEISRKHNVILNLFTNPEELSKLATVRNTEAIIVSYENSEIFQQKTAQTIFGAINAKGILPMKITDQFPRGTGIKTNLLSRLSYGLPEKVGLVSSKLKKIDSVVNEAIKSGVVPGAQILVARKGKVVYHQSFGKTRYEGGDPIQKDHLYDLASLTKILATLPMVMKLEETGKVGLKSTLKQFYPVAKGTNKEDITLLEMLTHYGRLKPWIPFYLYTLDSLNRKPSSRFYSNKPRPNFTTKVIGNLYIRDDYQDSIRKRILDTDLRKRKEYRYSDLPYYILKDVIEKKFGSSLDLIADRNLYRSIGASNTTFKPLEKFPRKRIVPSEDDNYFRHQVVQGYVHDMGAAMQGGVGGHAGLFSNANDVAKIMQMYLWDGYYGGKRYFKTGTIDRFNKCYFCESDNRRGVGFDKPQLVEKGPTCGCVSMKSFGHSGFTGTYTWADPEKEIVYVFLSNRTFPSSENRKLIKEGTRTVVQQLIYEAISE
jgi:beta-N-acetylhexosaminidase